MKKNSKRLLLPLSVLALAPWQVKGQDLSSIYTPNLFLGTLDIRIPLYEQNGIGATLSYNTKGIPVREMAGVAGLHWNLQAGGTIYRKIKGIPDEAKYQPTYTQPQDFLNAEHQAIAGKYAHYIGRLYEPLIPAASNVFTDPESDEYTFSAGNKFFTFYFGRNGEVFTDPKNKFEVYFLRDESYRKPNDVSSLAAYPMQPGIKVVDKEENKAYYFSASVRGNAMLTEYFLEPTMSLYNLSASGWYFTAVLDVFPEQWKLDSIVAAGNRVTKFSYQLFEIANQVAQDSSWVGHKFTGYVQPFPSPDIKMSKFYQVSAIEYPNRIRLNFVYNTTTRRKDIDPGNPSPDRYPFLEEVQLQEGDQQVRYRFDYAYYHSGMPPTYEVPMNFSGDGFADMYSLKLKGITQYSADGTESFPMYRFGYIDKKQRRFGGNLDLYGYYNDGQPSFFNKGVHSIADVVVTNTGGLYPVKNSSEAAAWGLLNGIENGYGGKVAFTYGKHTGLSAVASPLQSSGPGLINPAGLADGVRIESIISTDKHNPAKQDVTRFEYSQGQQFLAGGYCSDDLAQYTEGRVSYVSETFVSPNLLFQGANHGYGQVNVVNRNKEQQLLSRTEYTFSNFQDGTAPAKVLVTGGGQVTIAPPFFSSKQRIKDWEIGLPLSVKQYDNKDLIVAETRNEYTSKVDTNTARAMQVTDFNRRISLLEGMLFQSPETQPGINNPANIRNYTESIDPYIPYRGKSLLAKTVNYKYESNSLKVADSVEYRYDERDNQKYSYVRNSRGELIRYANIYNYELSSATIASNSTLSALQADDRELLIGTERWKSPATAGVPAGTEPVSGSERLLDASIFTSELLPNQVLATKSVYGLESADLIPGNIYREGMFAIGDPGYIAYSQVAKVWQNEPLPEYLVPATEARLFDAQGNVSQAYLPATEQYKVNIFDPNNFNKIVEVGNAQKSEVAFADFDHSIAGNLVYNANHIVRIGATFFPENPPPSVSGISSCISGRAYLAIAASGSTAKQVHTSGLPVGKEYRATFWASDHALPQFGIEGGTQFNLVPIATKGRFKQYEVLFTLAPGQENARIGINSPVNIALEDIRICPSNAAMQNWTYAPLCGVASVTDALGRLTYFEYDKLGRLVITRDQEGNILEKKSYGSN
ncbi:MAG: hypothetical protein EOP54_11915 [Sphingobacteriales bacterium]|nr:MAG: hypothetical protein EOP54_11915 [Sphingobacteriales bacterium]